MEGYPKLIADYKSTSKKEALSSIVVCPRSGTTLVDRVLCSSLKYTGVSESDVLDPFSELKMDALNLSYLGKAYVDLNDIKAKSVVNKLPFNFFARWLSRKSLSRCSNYPLRRDWRILLCLCRFAFTVMP